VRWQCTACALALSAPLAATAQDGPGVELHGQATYVRQAKPGFSAQYSGPKSLTAERDYAYSFTATAFLGTRLGAGWEAYFNPELTQGVPMSELQGLGGFNNGESQRTSGPILRGYRARAFVRKTWNIAGQSEQKESQANQVRTSYATERFVITAGNFSVLDMFDAVDYSRDARTQFLNWASLTYGAWDYAADARGYTWGAAAEYITPRWSVRAGRFLMPVESNGLTLNRHFTTHYGDAIEVERPVRIGERKAVLRVLAFHNRVNAGAFRDALNTSSPPDVAAVRHIQGKSGIAAGAQVELTSDVGAYLRSAWNDGKTETYAFSEIDRSLAAGVLVKGSRWGRGEDSVGLAGYLNTLSKDHRDYLAAGGQGFFLGDGRLNYSPERTLELFYSVNVVRGTWITANVQRTVNPGYNQDRGPAEVYNLRLHAEF
jgi:hypothetical protein